MYNDNRYNYANPSSPAVKNTPEDEATTKRDGNRAGDRNTEIRITSKTTCFPTGGPRCSFRTDLNARNFKEIKF